MDSQAYHQEQFRIAEQLEISEVMDCRTGAFHCAREVIGTDRERFFVLRNEIVAGILADRPLFRCAICHVPVKLIAPYDKGAHFRHELEDGRCPALTRGTLSESQIRALKYNGAKESEPHRAMKEWLAASLRADAHFTAVHVEETWTSGDRSAWRRPDVQAVFKNVRVAFEIQLSTTFLDVIVERREFYRREGGLLFWVFKEFPAEHRRMTLEDVFYNNNRNAFVVSPDTVRRSREGGRFLLECQWVEPTASEKAIGEKWRSELVGFDQLTLDTMNQRAWFFDCDKARNDCRAAFRQGRLASCKARAGEFCVKAMEESFGYDERVKLWRELQEEFKSVEIALPAYDRSERLRKLFCFLFSIEEGKPVGFKFQKLVQVGHHAFDKHKCLLRIFGYALKAYKRSDQLSQEDSSGKWAKRVEEHRDQINACEGEFKPDTTYDEIIVALFPELEPKLRCHSS